MSLFISYTHSDDAQVRLIKNDLERMGRSVWLDHQIHGGERWWHEIIQQIQTAEVFVFALSKDSWQSRPCRAELKYAEELRVPVLPLLVGSLDSRRIEIAERQIVDYRERSADAVLELMSALDEIAATPWQLPDPLPMPPSVPFEYLHRISIRIDVQESILRETQEQLIDELRRRLRDENDQTARNDILQLLRQLRDRPEITVPHAAEIDAILQGTEAKSVPPPADGATRLPPADHWRREKTTADSAGKATETPLRSGTPPAPGFETSSVAAGAAESPSQRTAKLPAWQSGASGQHPPSPAQSPPSAPPSAQSPLSSAPPFGQSSPSSRPRTSERSSPSQPGTSGRSPSPPGPSARTTSPAAPADRKVPSWLADIVGGSGTPGAGAGDRSGRAGTASSTQRPHSASPPEDVPQWWPDQSRKPFSEEQPHPPPSPRSATSEGRFAFTGAVLGSMGIPLSLLSLGDRSFATVVTTLLLILAVLGLSMAIVAATRREPWARAAVVLGAVGLISTIVALVAGI